MFRGLGPTSDDSKKPKPDASDVLKGDESDGLPRRGGSKGRLFAVIARPFNVFGRGMSATAIGVSTVVQSPVRVARNLRREDVPAARRDLPHPEVHTALSPPQDKARAAWDGFVSNVKSRLEGAQQMIPGAQATPNTTLRQCWPAKLSLSSGSGAAALKGTHHDLVATGIRKLGVARLQVDIYDFAVYVDSHQTRRSQLRRRSPWVADPEVQHSLRSRQSQTPPPGGKQLPTAMPQHQPDFAKRLINSKDIDMSLVVRASRNLPLKLMMGEYERILRRRLNSVGGSPNDPALVDMLAAFSEECLPKGVVKGGNVQKGAVLMFKRSSGGKVTASADGQDLVTVSSPAFAAAVFDLYLGNRPVSPTACATALDGVARMMSHSDEAYAPVVGQSGMCARFGEVGGCQRQPLWQPWQQIFHPS